MRPIIGKGKWWERKAIQKPYYKYAVIETLEAHYSINSWEMVETKRISVVADVGLNEDFHSLRVLIRNLTHEDAIMWAKMM